MIQLELNLHIEVIKCINTNFLSRTDKIYSSIFGRTASYCSTDNIVFIEKNTIDSPEFFKTYNIIGSPYTIIFKNYKPIYRFQGIKPQSQLMEILEEVQYL